MFRFSPPGGFRVFWVLGGKGKGQGEGSVSYDDEDTVVLELVFV